jgi:hypothetical protein
MLRCRSSQIYEVQTEALRGFSSKTLAIRLKEHEKGGILERQAYHEIPPRVEYRLTSKGQELCDFFIAMDEKVVKAKGIHVELRTVNPAHRPSWNTFLSMVEIKATKTKARFKKDQFSKMCLSSMELLRYSKDFQAVPTCSWLLCS